VTAATVASCGDFVEDLERASATTFEVDPGGPGGLDGRQAAYRRLACRPLTATATREHNLMFSTVPRCQDCFFHKHRFGIDLVGPDVHINAMREVCKRVRSLREGEWPCRAVYSIRQSNALISDVGLCVAGWLGVGSRCRGGRFGGVAGQVRDG
jgi:hypothetical protein